jgi:hypothetical protein
MSQASQQRVSVCVVTSIFCCLWGFFFKEISFRGSFTNTLQFWRGLRFSMGRYDSQVPESNFLLIPGYSTPSLLN